ncbi:hypothetical protein AMJ82_08165 [candidate division TA06 bacterium SM23_40]|uniref:MalT-like TPR region domain-containing protein n=1 Tax=candidate division TA06 bacterium SM23_40 TaxID=1703774 RepID=A0A0S8G6X5_UNCT6|nr:MAG: hypothetical protein AMJ82_08165 [candidate division TA06 bacterium SM23_40]
MAELLTDVRTLLREGDSYEAIELIHKVGEPAAVADSYLELVKHLYWKERALPEVVTIARAGIQYCLTRAQDVPEGESELAATLRGTAKALAYNLASFTWPGWEEEGIVITPPDLMVGLDAAKLNLRLARELGREPSVLSAAHWALGAQYVAAGKYDEAMNAFSTAEQKAREAEDDASVFMNLGYLGIARILEGSGRKEGEKQLKEAVEGLKKLNTEDSRFFADQLKSVLGVFADRARA